MGENAIGKTKKNKNEIKAIFKERNILCALHGKRFKKNINI